VARKILLDCDPGHDDAVALLLALGSPEELALDGVSVVGGNVPLQGTVSNTRKLLHLVGRTDLPVYAGCPRPMMREIVTAEHVHGDSGLDSASGRLLEEPDVPVAPVHAVNYLIDSVRNSPPGEVTLVATGPLTNVAVAFAMAPDIIERLDQVVIMGGACFEQGNVTPAAEFNVYVDPHAARAVFESGVRLTMFGLDVTHQMRITPARLKAMAENGVTTSVNTVGTARRCTTPARWRGLSIPRCLKAWSCTSRWIPMKGRHWVAQLQIAMR